MRITVDSHHGSRSVSRRQLLRLAAFTVTGLTLLPACSTPAPAAPAKAPTTAPAATAATTAPAAAPASPPAASGSPSASPAAAGSPSAAAPSPAAKPVAQPAQQAPAVASSGTVRVAVPRSINAIDARIHRTTEEQNIFHHLYDSLVDLDPKLGLRPRLAESWEAVDATTWRFKLRQGVTFTNGEPFNAEAAAFTIEQYAGMQPPYFYANLWSAGWPPSATVEGPYSVLVKTPAPQPSLPRLMTRVGMLPPGATKEAGYADKPISTGPYKVVEWAKGKQLVLEANAGYWRGAPKIGQLIWQSIPDQAARVAALRAREVDVIWDVPFDRAAEVTATHAILEAQTASMGFVGFNFRAPQSPIANVKVRRALTHAVDDKGILDAIMSGKAVPAKGPSPALAVGSYDGGGYPKRDVAMAKKLLAEAGHPNGLNLTMIFAAGEFAKDLEVVEAIIGQLGEAGVEVKLEELDSAQLSQRRPLATWDLTSNGATGWTTEATFFANQLRTTMGYTSAAVDQFQTQANAAGDTPQRVGLIQQTMKAMWEDVPYLWSFDRVFLFGMEKKIQGAEFIPVGWLLLNGAQLTG